jgi:hypothetical protein
LWNFTEIPLRLVQKDWEAVPLNPLSEFLFPAFTCITHFNRYLLGLQKSENRTGYYLRLVFENICVNVDRVPSKWLILLINLIELPLFYLGSQNMTHHRAEDVLAVVPSMNSSNPLSVSMNGLLEQREISNSSQNEPWRPNKGERDETWKGI